MLAVGAGGGCLDIFFSRLSFFYSFSLSLGDGPIWTEILSQRAVKPKTTNQPMFFKSKANNVHNMPTYILSKQRWFILSGQLQKLVFLIWEWHCAFSRRV